MFREIPFVLRSKMNESFDHREARHTAIHVLVMPLCLRLNSSDITCGLLDRMYQKAFAND